MKKLTYLALVLLVFGACKTKKTATKAAQKTVQETTIEDFATFLGLQKGNVEEKAILLLGKQTKDTRAAKDSYSFFTNYYDDENERMFSYTVDKKTNVVNHIRLTGDYTTNFASTKAYLKKMGINDPKIDFLGMHKDEILKIMGTPDRVNSGNYEFKKGAISITFICYEFRQEKCSEIYLFWNMYYTEPTK